MSVLYIKYIKILLIKLYLITQINMLRFIQSINYNKNKNNNTNYYI